MANRGAGLDPTLVHLPTPTHTAHAAAGHCHSTPAPWIFPAAAFENEALTCALRASMSPANACASSSYPITPSSSSTSSASELLTSPAPESGRAVPPPARTVPKAGRVTKRKSRPSRRPPPTYIVADPANFRRMVQEVTGLPVVASSGVGVLDAAAEEPASASASARSWSPTPPPACILPTLDTSAFLLDRAVATPARGQDDKSPSGGASPATTAAAKEEEDDDSSLFLELEAMACAPPAFLADDFPTLESWGII